MTYHETTEERFWNMLGALPPRAYHAGGFLVGEPVSARLCDITGEGAPTFEAYFEIDGRYYQADKPVTVREFLAIKQDEVGP